MVVGEDPPAGLVGRVAAWTTCIGLVEAVAAGRGGVLWVEGDAGVGKSRLMEEVMRRAGTMGCNVHVGYADELTATIALRPVVEGLGVAYSATDQSRVAVWAILHGDLGAEPHLDAVRAATERLLALVDDLCTAHPLMLIIEDVQWADESTLALWERLRSATKQIPLLLVATSRVAPAQLDASWARSLVEVRAGGGQHIVLDPLRDDDEIAHLVSALLGRQPGPRLLRAVSPAAGNPLYIREIVRSLADADLASTADAVDLIRVPPLPRSLAETIAPRLDLIDPVHGQRLRIAALLGNRFRADDLAAVLGLPEAESGETLRIAETAGLVIGHTTVTFAHDLIRQVLVDQTPEAIRAALHAHIAHSLIGTVGTEDNVAGHLTRVPDPLPSWALDWLTEVAESKLPVAAATSADLLRRALLAVNEDDARRGLLAARLVHVLFRLGRDAELIDVGRAALGHLGAAEEAGRVRVEMVRALARTGRFTEAVAVADEGLAMPDFQPAWRSRLRSWGAAVRPNLGEISRAQHDAEVALAEAEKLRDGYSIASAHYALGFVDRGPGGMVHIAQGLSALGDDPDSNELRMMMLSVQGAQLGVDAPLEAEPALARTLMLAERIGAYHVSVVLSLNAQVLYGIGRWDDAINHIEQIDRNSRGQPAMAYLYSLQALIAYHRDLREDGDRLLLAAGVEDTVPVTHPGFSSVFHVEAAALRAETRGDLERALLVRAQFLDSSDGRSAIRTNEGAFLIRLALSLGRRDLAERAAQVAHDQAEEHPGTDLLLRWCSAMLKSDVTELATVANALTTFGWPLWGASAIEDAAAACAAGGDQVAARESLRTAVNMYEELGASWDIRRCEARLRQMGIRLGVRGERRRPKSGWESLTPTELRITRLVAKGLSNPDIARDLMISRNTVETHVSKALQRLGATSRVGLSRLVAEHDGAA